MNRRRMMMTNVKPKILYVYQSGVGFFENCAHRSETHEGIIPNTYYDACSIDFGDGYFVINNSAHQNATNRVYYFYLDMTGYKKVVVKAKNPSTSSETGESRVGIFSSDGLKSGNFTEETSRKIEWSLSEPNSYEFDVENLAGTKVLAFRNSSRYAQPQIYEIRME